MSAAPRASLADLARWLKVREVGTEDLARPAAGPIKVDGLELVSAWQRLPARSGQRWGLTLGAVTLSLLVLAFAVQSALTGQLFPILLAFGMLVAAGITAWRIRSWFWRIELTVNAEAMTLLHHGWYAPPPCRLLLPEINALCFRQSDGKLQALSLLHAQGALVIPISGQRELDRLYCNLLRHLLQKHRAEIGFRELDTRQEN